MPKMDTFGTCDAFCKLRLGKEVRKKIVRPSCLCDGVRSAADQDKAFAEDGLSVIEKRSAFVMVIRSALVIGTLESHQFRIVIRLCWVAPTFHVQRSTIYQRCSHARR